MKKSIFGKIGAAAVVLTLVTGSLVGGTFAKYTSTAIGTGTAQVAAWKIAMKEGTNPIAGDAFSFNLINMNDKAATTDGKIAPGSFGEIKLSIDGTGSDVGYSYKIEADTSALTGVPIKFYSDAEKKTELTPVSGKITVSSADVDLDAVGTPVAADIYWEWNKDSIDTADTTLGVNGSSGTITVTMTADQLIKTEGTPAS